MGRRRDFETCVFRVQDRLVARFASLPEVMGSNLNVPTRQVCIVSSPYHNDVLYVMHNMLSKSII